MTKLTYSIENAPPEIDALADSLGIERIARPPPRLYTKKDNDGIRAFNRERAERNLDAIAAICDGVRWIISDIENDHRDAVRRPDNYSPKQVKASVNQYVACWLWFRIHWPDALIFEWNLTNAREPGRHPLAEDLVLKKLNGFAVSLFYRRKRNWQVVREQIVAHANSLVAGTSKIVVAGIHEKYNSDEAGGQIPVPRKIIGPMIEVALRADVAMLWSNSFKGEHPPTGDERQLDIALVAEVMSRMRVQAEDQTP